jgi:tetratricopeptide (TPR) repeat protein
LAQCIKANDYGQANYVCNQISDAAGVNAALQIIAALPQATDPHFEFLTSQYQFKKQAIPEARKSIDAVLANTTKLTDAQQAEALGFAGSLYMQTPDPNFDKARDLYLQLLRLRPDDYRIYNNLACNPQVSAADSLDYSHKAFDLMQKTGNYDPLVADTFGWNEVQNDPNGLDNGLQVLLDAWKSEQIVDIAYHLGAAYLKKGNPNEASKYLTQAQSLFNDELKNNTVTDMTLQQKIIDAQRQANDKRAKAGP